MQCHNSQHTTKCLYYRAVDSDDRYDDIVQESRDAEEKYFDESDEESSANGNPSLLAPDEYDY